MRNNEANAVLRASCLLLPLLLGGCEGVQSAFSAFGVEAERVRTLTISMSVGAALLTAGVLWMAFHAGRAPAGSLDLRGGMNLILWCGALLPTLVLAALLLISLPGMRTLATDPQTLRIEVAGEQFWWRVRYLRGSGGPVESANEVRVPVGQTVAFELASDNVIHSFWIPGLAGKVDMIPGHRNELVVRATRTGIYRGACAEFCGLSHANMAFDVVAMEPADFDRWLAQAAGAAVEVRSEGSYLFEQYGCSGCHVVRGHVTGTPIGPDLTHFGQRRTFAAGMYRLDRQALQRFVRDAPEMKPGALMPAFESMSSVHAAAIAGYLMELR